MCRSAKSKKKARKSKRGGGVYEKIQTWKNEKRKKKKRKKRKGHDSFRRNLGEKIGTHWLLLMRHVGDPGKKAERKILRNLFYMGFSYK